MFCCGCKAVKVAPIIPAPASKESSLEQPSEHGEGNVAGVAKAVIATVMASGPPVEQAAFGVEALGLPGRGKVYAVNTAARPSIERGVTYISSPSAGGLHPKMTAGSGDEA